MEQLKFLRFICRNKYSRIMNEYLCFCGKTFICEKVNVDYKFTKSCGCYRRDSMIGNKRNLSHAKSQTRIYKIWSNMKNSCNHPRSANYLNIGAKGIKYKKEWEIFEVFFEDMNETYSDDCDLKRYDTTKDFDDKNCYWNKKPTYEPFIGRWQKTTQST